MQNVQNTVLCFFTTMFKLCCVCIVMGSLQWISSITTSLPPSPVSTESYMSQMVPLHAATTAPPTSLKRTTGSTAPSSSGSWPWSWGQSLLLLSQSSLLGFQLWRWRRTPAARHCKLQLGIREMYQGRCATGEEREAFLSTMEEGPSGTTRCSAQRPGSPSNGSWRS